MEGPGEPLGSECMCEATIDLFGQCCVDQFGQSLVDCCVDYFLDDSANFAECCVDHFVDYFFDDSADFRVDYSLDDFGECGNDYFIDDFGDCCVTISSTSSPSAASTISWMIPPPDPQGPSTPMRLEASMSHKSVAILDQLEGSGATLGKGVQQSIISSTILVIAVSTISSTSSPSAASAISSTVSPIAASTISSTVPLSAASTISSTVTSRACRRPSRRQRTWRPRSATYQFT